jgi:hypothetical protein
MDLIECPHCQTRVIVSRDGTCPACRRSISAPVQPVDGAEANGPADPLAANANLVTIARFIDPVEASLAKNCLEDAGFQAFLADFETVSIDWQIASAIGAIKLQVFDTDVEAARSVLRDQLEGANGDESEPIDEAIDPDSVAGVPDDDDSDDLEPEPNAREKAAERALKGAVLGLLFWPLQAYVSYLLMTVYFSSQTLAGRSRRHALIAAVINLPFFIVGLYGVTAAIAMCGLAAAEAVGLI